MQSVLSRRVLALEPSSLYAFFRRVLAMVAGGKNIIVLGLGEPEDNTPDHIKQAGVSAILGNKTKYVPSNGSMDVRERIAEKYGARAEEVVVSHSAKIMNWALYALTNPGDHVLVPSPFFPPFVQVVRGLECVPDLIETADHDFQVKAEMVRKAIRRCEKKPKVLILNSPNNPTGAIYSEKDLREIAVLAIEEGIFVLADECYSQFSPAPNFSFRSINPESGVFNSVSKAYAMTGWRLGWGVMPKWLAERVELALDHFLGPPNSITERAVLTALGSSGIEDYTSQRKIMRVWLKRMSIPCSQFDGAFYAFPNFSVYTEKVGGGVALAEKMLEYGVAVTPGTAFGDYNDYLRLAYCVSPEKLIEATKRMEAALKSI